MKPPKVTKLEDAKAMRRMGVPLNTEVEERTFSDEYSTHWIKLMNAQGAFMAAFHRFAAEDNTPRQWRNVKRAFKVLSREIEQCGAYVGEEPDPLQAAILAGFLADRAAPFMAYFQDVIVRIDAHHPVTLRAEDIPPWVEEESSA
jgi:hypothetical protein